MLLESKPSLQILLILLAATLICLPCLLYGLPSSTNALTHIKYQHHFSHQFWNGESYPRWLAEENKGFGSPIFLAQYPLPYYVTALLRPITSFPSDSRESRELGLFCFLALASAGLAAWYWIRKFTHPLAATLAAMLYMSLPFILEDGIYSRGAIGELCTFIWMPLALSISESMYQNRKAIFVLAGVFALLILSNLLTTALFAPALTIYAVMYAKQTEPSLFKRAFPVFLAEMLGAGLAAIYLVPTIAYRRLLDLPQMESILPGYQFALYFLNLTSSNLERRVISIALGTAVLFAAVAAWHIWKTTATPLIRNLMALVLILGTLTLIPNLGLAIVRLSGFHLRPAPPAHFSALMLLGLFFTVALAFLAYCRIAESNRNQRALLLLCIVAGSFFLMLPFSAPIWRVLPGSAAVQFPYRLGGTLCVAAIGLIAMAFDSCFRDSQGSHRPSRFVVALAALGTIFTGLMTLRADRYFFRPELFTFDATQDVDPMYRAYVPVPKLFGFASILGTAPDSYAIEEVLGDAPHQTRLTAGDCDINVKRESPREFAISSDCKEKARLQIGLLYSPLWRIVPLQSTSENSVIDSSSQALTQITLIPGKQVVRLVFDIGSPERLGAILSGASLLVGLLGFVFSRDRRARSLSELQSKQLRHAEQ